MARVERSESSELLFLLIVKAALFFQHKQFFYSNAVQITNDKYIDSVPLSEACESSNRESPCGITPVVKVNLTEDLNGPIVYLRVYELSTNKTLIKQTLNVCSMTKQPGLNIFVRFVSEQLKESTNFKFECPVRKVHSTTNPFRIIFSKSFRIITKSRASRYRRASTYF